MNIPRLSRRPAFGFLGFILAVGTASAQITVTSERRATAYPTDGTFVFNTVPSNSSTDLANGKAFTVLAGTPNANGPVSNLSNGPAQTNHDSVAESFFANGNTADGSHIIRVQIDLGADHVIEQINSYSWHQNSRAPQNYKVYGASSPTNNAPNFTAAGFQNETALNALGYTLIASVFTAQTSAGQYGASIAGSIGNYRYLLFDMAPPTTSASPRPTFFGEIDIIGEPVGPSRFPLSITPATSPATGFNLVWDCQPGKRYNLRTSTDLGSPIGAWELLQGNIAATPPSNTFNVAPAGPRRFYAVEEFETPPLLQEDFENDDGGFTVVTLGGTPWEYGVPDSPTPVEGAVTKANSGLKCWGTNLTGAYDPASDSSLRSPAIDLTGITAAKLTFVQALDLDTGHTLEVNVLRASDNVLLANLIPATGDGNPSNATWQAIGPVALPSQAFGQSIRIEWRFIGDGSASFNGAYIDDVMVTEGSP